MGISENIKPVSFDEVKDILPQLEYALVYEMSNVRFGKIDILSEINWDECMEAYFFDMTKQIHVYREGDEIHAFEFTENDNMEYVDKEYELANAYKAAGKKLLRREYLEYDDDGQVYVVYTRLVNVE